MAINIELLGWLSPIFVFILVYVGLYAVLMKLKFFSDKAGINGLISFSIAFLFILFPFLKEVITEALPWIVIIFACMIIILMIMMFMGYKQESLVDWMAQNSFGTIVTVIVLLVFGGALAKVFSSPEAQAAWGGFESVKSVLLNSKVLGALIILVIAAKVMHSVGFEK